ncbi:DNA polymerase I [bacterium]|nr:DNA polymerase I [bacterium]
MGKTLILIDGHALAFRQYYALERTNMQTSDGTPTWAVYGFFKAIFDLLKNPDLNPDAIAVAFDVSHRTFRTEKYEDYKCNREAMPVPMKSQMELINEGLEAFGIPVYTKEGYEADDVIGTISKEACELGHKVLILTGDQDAFQLIDKDGCVKVILPSKGELVEYDWNKVHEKLGIYPDQVIDYKALRGDTSDCIPGIKGIGEKTAQKLLAEHYTLQEVLAHSAEISQKSLREKIENGVEQAKLSQYLATIVRDLDVNFDFEKTKVELPEISAVTAFLKNMQFYSFIKNIDEILYSFTKDGEKPKILTETETALSTVPSAPGQLGLFTQAIQAEINKNDDTKYSKRLITDNEDLDDLFIALKKRSCIAFEIEAEVLSAVKSIITGINIGFTDKMTADNALKFESDEELEIKTFYIPLSHSSLTKQLPYKLVIDKLKEIFEDENIKKITYDLKRQYNILRNYNVDLKSCIFDVMLASYVKDPTRNHELDIQAMERIDHSVVPFAPYEKDKKKQIQFKDAVLDNILGYTADRISTIVNLTKFWNSSLDAEELKIVYDIEVPLAMVLADMEFNGVSIDTKYLSSLSYSMTQKLFVLEKKIFEIAQESFNINSPRQVADILFNKLGYKGKKKRGKNQNSTSAEVLEILAEEYEIARYILEYRKYAKLKSTYTDALPALVDVVDKRIHTTYNQTVTTTGRLSSSNPNLQNIPVRTEEGNQIRKAFVPKDRENYLILSADYSQIELRLLAHISGDTHLIKAFNSGEDIHTITASKVFEVPVDKVTKEMRYKAKAVNFGIIYGQSKYGLAKALGITKDVAEDFINKYFKTYPMVKAYMEAIVMETEKNGYVQTLFGRKRDLTKELNSSNAMVREFAKRAAINHPMQGTAADLMKIAMISFEKNLKDNGLKSKMIMQVHDELVVEVKKDELELVKKLVTEAMELNRPFEVPLVVDVNIGETWEE